MYHLFSERLICECKLVFNWSLKFFWASLVAQLVKNLPAVQGTQLRSLGQEDSLEKEMATHSSILAWKFRRLQSMGLLRVAHD